jgi:hypothetical protein
VAGGDDTAATTKTVAKDCEEAVSTRHAAGFTDNLKCLEKSTPIIGNFTFAKRKIQEKRRPWNDRDLIAVLPSNQYAGRWDP